MKHQDVVWPLVGAGIASLCAIILPVAIEAIVVSWRANRARWSYRDSRWTIKHGRMVTEYEVDEKTQLMVGWLNDES
jgi:hypothetical protein